ncbi:response regulator transcription factor [Lederbergia graminis]|uniref:Response regulator n=1 Tax=Lederbergia graminis TaxID=735518 RepID=A0ABW0LMU4_9BACI
MLYKLLIVDDEKIIRQSIESKVRRLQHPLAAILHAENGLEAKNIVQETAPDIIITDVCMPKMDGIELIQELVQVGSNSKIIVLSAFDDYAFVRKAFKYGVLDYLIKPINTGELHQQLTRIYKDLHTKEGENLETERHSPNSIINIVKDYVRKHYDRNITLSEAANLVNMNYSYFSKLFSEEANVSFSQYVMQVRMEKAKELLTDPINRINEISERVGYSNIYHFSRAFKNYAGCSPTDFRKTGVR